MPALTRKCATCDVALVGDSVDLQPSDLVSCPQCGVSDTLENVDREIMEQLGADQIGDVVESIRRGIRGNKMMQLREKQRVKKSYRFTYAVSAET